MDAEAIVIPAGQVPLAYVLAMPLGMKSKGVFFSIALAESAMAAASAILFKRGKWKRQKI
jgi:Na+-driven multidrug efflux pump